VGYVGNSVYASCCQTRCGYHFFYQKCSTAVHGSRSAVQLLQCRTLNFLLNCGPSSPKLNSNDTLRDLTSHRAVKILIVSQQYSKNQTASGQHTHTHTHTRLTALFPGLHGSASTGKVKPIWILLKQETVSGSGISWVMCKSAPRSRQITTPAPHHSVFYRPDVLPATQPTASNH